MTRVTTTPGAPRARAPFPTLLGLALVLLVMAVVLAVVWLGGGDSNSACASSGASSGECLLETQLDSVRADLLGGGVAALFAGGVVAGAAGLTQLIWDRRR